MLTLIVGRNYAAGMIWLRDNASRLKLDPQKCRVLTTSLPLKGLNSYKIVWLPGWSDGPSARAIHDEFMCAKVKYGNAIEEVWG